MEPLKALCQEVIILNRHLRAVSERLHGGDAATTASRGVMGSLLASGPQTVPHLARTRLVSRQHIQTLVDQMVREGFVELISNPDHKRSPLVQLTDLGRKTIARMRTREKKLCAVLESTISRQRLVEAVDTLQNVRQLLDGDWEKTATRRVLKKKTKI